MRRLACQWLFLITLSTGSIHGLADGSAVTQIYSPYVQPLEKELEFVWIHDDRHKGHTPSSTSAKVGYGTSFFTNLYTEVSITHLNTDEGSLDEIELETIWQLTEQGEYSSDWGLLFELETALGEDAHEISLGVLNQKDINRWSIVSNVVVSYEWGAQRQDEPETRLGIQTRYRLGTAFEPTMELFMGDETRAIGPGATGIYKMPQARQLRWNAAILFGVDGYADYTAKLEFEYEFF